MKRSQIVYSQWINENRPLVAAALASVLVVAVVAALAHGRALSENETRWIWFFRLKPNEMGDTLAGIFSSLTLVWIIASVFHQSRELREQRKQFSAMALAQESQVKALDAQILVLHDERDRRVQNDEKEITNVLLADLVRTYELVGFAVKWEFYRDEDDYTGMADEYENLTSTAKRIIVQPFTGLSSSSLDERFYECARSVFEAYMTITNNDNFSRCAVRAQKTFFQPLIEKIDQIVNQSLVLNRVEKVRVEALKVHQMREQIRQLLELDVWMLNVGEVDSTP